MNDSRANLPENCAELIGADRICGGIVDCSSKTWRRWTAAAKTPAPVRIGGKVYWRRSEVLDWIHMGCPTRRKFEALQKSVI